MLRDHPVIENLERTGSPDGKDPTYPICPVCGCECEDIYKADGVIVGCDMCIERVDAWECEELFQKDVDENNE